MRSTNTQHFTAAMLSLLLAGTVLFCGCTSLSLFKDKRKRAGRPCRNTPILDTPA